MSMINKGIPYFPTPANFFDEEIMELLEAKFGILSSYIVMRLLCKIYKEGYYISWGKEQSLIFVRKVGGGIKEEVMEKIIELWGPDLRADSESLAGSYCTKKD